MNLLTQHALMEWEDNGLVGEDKVSSLMLHFRVKRIVALRWEIHIAVIRRRKTSPSDALEEFVNLRKPLNRDFEPIESGQSVKELFDYQCDTRDCDNCLFRLTEHLLTNVDLGSWDYREAIACRWLDPLIEYPQSKNTFWVRNEDLLPLLEGIEESLGEGQ
jgi:hypothetical protein